MGRAVVNGTLYVVGTPLGHLGDLSARAAEILRTVDLVAAEDTRRTRTLLAHIGARPKMVSYHAHSDATRIDSIVERLDAGCAVALVTDAGTPAVSDPGAILVARVRQAGHQVVVIPGPSAVAAALSGAGFSADRYTFLGFLPRKGTERRAFLTTATESQWTVVLYEAANRLVSLLEDLAQVAPHRPAAVARELTKVHEEFKIGTLTDLAVYYREHAPRGEVTVVLEGTGQVRRSRAFDSEEVEQLARALLDHGLSRKDIARRIMEDFDLPRNEAYRLVNDL